MEKNVEYLESLQCVLISPHEVINALYYTEITCSDPECVNYTRSTSSDAVTGEPKTRSVSLDICLNFSFIFFSFY